MNTRYIPTLLLHDGALVKTVHFRNFNYIGDPCNTIRIFNELEVDELILLDILASRKNAGPDFELIEDVASECFMPLSYGGGLKNLEQISRVLRIGVEKVVINSHVYENVELVRQAADTFGSQCIIGAIDVKKTVFGKYCVYAYSGRKKMPLHPIDWAMELQRLGVGELFVNSIDMDGSWRGFDYGLIRDITDAVSVPVIACGGAGSMSHIDRVVKDCGASAVGLGSMVVYQKKGMGVLISMPDQPESEKVET